MRTHTADPSSYPMSARLARASAKTGPDGLSHQEVRQPWRPRLDKRCAVLVCTKTPPLQPRGWPSNVVPSEWVQRFEISMTRSPAALLRREPSSAGGQELDRGLLPG